MKQHFRAHRQFQFLSWIDALSRGYEAPEHQKELVDEPVIDEPHRMPTVSNLAYYLLTKAEYNKETLKEQVSHLGIGRTPDKDVFTAAKRDVARHLTQYPGDLFTTKTVKKSAEDHPTFDAGLESRCVEAKAYYLTKHGQDRLASLTDVMDFKQKQIDTEEVLIDENGEKKCFLTEDAVNSISGEIDSKTVAIDSITVPKDERWRWDVQIYYLPHVDVVDAARDQAPTVYRE